MEPAPNPIDPPPHSLVAVFRSRAARQRLHATLVVALLGAVIAATVATYLFAAQLDVSAWGPLTNQRLARIGDYGANWKEKSGFLDVELALKLGKSCTDPRLLESLGRAAEATAEAERRRSREVLALRQEVQQIQKIDDANDQRRFISALFTRAGAIIVLLFFSSFLIGQYRHASQLANSYDAIADALLFDPARPERLREFFGVGHLGFSSPPTPLKEIADVTKNVSGSS